VLHPLGLLSDVDKVTGYPGLKSDMSRSNEIVCYSNYVLTSQGPATAIPFSLRIIELLLNEEKAKEIAK
jgi:4-methyl-5(b-hydroxyethyl)-thiazole monophosphate biosynthesis